MNITCDEVVKKLYEKIEDAVSTLSATKNHLNSFQKDFESTVVVQLKSAKAALKEKKREFKEALNKSEKLMEAKNEETVKAVAEWKAKRLQQKLEIRAERAEGYADACVTLALYYAAEAELAILEAITASQDVSAGQQPPPKHTTQYLSEAK